jgi:AraC-like DNA-binding protein
MTEYPFGTPHPLEDGPPPLSNRFFKEPGWIAALQHFKCGNRIAYPDHAHNETSIVICTDGYLESVQVGVREVLQPGDIIITNRNTIHSSRYGMDGEISEGLTLDLDTSTYLSILRALSLRLPRPVEACVFLGKIRMPQIAKMAKDLIRAVGPESASYAGDKNALMRKILVDVLRAWPAASIHPVCHKVKPLLARWDFIRSVELMTANGRDQFLVRSLYGEFDLAASTFNKLFRNTTGLTALQLFHRILVSRACRMLEDQSASIKEIAYSLDFRSVSHFCTLFKTVTGLSPNTYRARMTATS